MKTMTTLMLKVEIQNNKNNVKCDIGTKLRKYC